MKDHSARRRIKGILVVFSCLGWLVSMAGMDNERKTMEAVAAAAGIALHSCSILFEARPGVVVPIFSLAKTLTGRAAAAAHASCVRT